MPAPDDPRSLRHAAPDVPADDAVIGRAFWWSLAVFVALGSTVAAIVWTGRKTSGTERRPLSILSGAKSPTDFGNVPVPDVRFTDVTMTSGLRFEHFAGATGDRLLPETMGPGVAFIDLDNDEDPDLFCVNGTSWPWSPADRQRRTLPALYRNDGGRLVDITPGSGLEVSLQGMGVACGDFDNDGRIDLFVTAVGDQRLFRNLGHGRFQDVTESAGLRADPEDWGSSAGFLDYDRDGDLDLFVCRYLRWSRDIDLDVDYRLVGIGRAYGPPMNFPGTFPRLFRNDANGRFTDVSAACGIQVRNKATGNPMAKSLGVAPVDFNSDGWIDLIVANDTTQNLVFSNRWDGTFAEIGAESGLAFDTFGAARGAMGIDAGRFTEDASLGVSIGNFANEMLALYVTQPDTVIFADEAIGQGVGAASRQSLTFGVFFFDFDLDGWLDLLTVNGHIESEIHVVQSSQTYRQPPQLFWNTRGTGENSGFLAIQPKEPGIGIFQPLVARGSAYADFDGDGDLDVVITQNQGPAVLLRNDLGTGRPWIRLRLVGTRSNRDAIGAWVRLTSGSHTWWRQVMPTRGYLSQSELPITFGLQEGRGIDDIEIRWPSGIRQRIPPADLRIRAVNMIREPDEPGNVTPARR
ncbi:MAG: CRTAC1 family protein [Limisphaerales bacterium]